MPQRGYFVGLTLPPLLYYNQGMNINGYGIGLDLATRVTGVFGTVGDKFQGGKIIKADGVADMGSKLWDYLDEQKPDWVAVESTYLDRSHKNVHTKGVLDEVRGVVRMWCHRNQAAFYTAPTAKIDSACGIPTGIKRRARKLHTQAFAKTCGFVVPGDVADALCVTHWGFGEWRKDQWIKSGEEDG